MFQYCIIFYPQGLEQTIYIMFSECFNKSIHVSLIKIMYSIILKHYFDHLIQTAKLSLNIFCVLTKNQTILGLI